MVNFEMNPVTVLKFKNSKIYIPQWLQDRLKLKGGEHFTLHTTSQQGMYILKQK